MFMRASFSFLESVSKLTAWSELHDSRVKNKKPFIHNRDEEFSPRYHPNSVERFEGQKLQVSTFNF